METTINILNRHELYSADTPKFNKSIEDDSDRYKRTHKSSDGKDKIFNST